jgi:hypothetical protein
MSVIVPESVEDHEMDCGGSLEVKNAMNFIGTTNFRKSASVTESVAIKQEKMDCGGSIEVPNFIISIGTKNF